MKVLLVLISSLFVFTTAQADSMDMFEGFSYDLQIEDFDLEANMGGKKGKGCPMLQLTDDQKDDIKEIMKGLMNSMFDYRLAVQKAKLGLVEVMIDESSAIADAKAAHATLISKVSDAKTAMGEARLEVLYNVLSTDQRRPFLMCMAKMKKMRKMKKMGGKGKMHPKN
jgi:Spy/CpxP family protein refolding chaperone